MEPSDVFGLTVFLHELYGERFPQMSDSMARIWYEDLRRYDADDADAAIRQWARQHTMKAPSLDELCEAIEFLVEERRKHRRRGSDGKGYAEILREAAEAQARNPERSEDDATYGHLMATIGERSVAPWVDEKGERHEKLTLEQRATQCYEWANHSQAKRPSLAEDLRHAARIYARIYHEEAP